MIMEYLLKKLADATFEVAKDALRRTGTRLLSTRQQLKDAIDHHQRLVNTWAGEVSFVDLHRAKATHEVFIPLDLYVRPRRTRIHASVEQDTIPFLKIVEQTSRHIVMLGQPGAGKTTSMKFVSYSVLKDKDFCRNRYSLPIVVKLRELNNVSLADHSALLLDHLLELLSLTTQSSGSSDAERTRTAKEAMVIAALDKLKAILIVDGLDELQKKSHRDSVIRDIRTLASGLSVALLIMTTRTGDFVYSIENVDTYELAPMTESQLTQFANRWLGNSQDATSFISKLRSSPFHDTLLRPLTLGHLCAIYERIGTIPEKPKTVYRKIVNLLLEEWDQQRSVKRQSRYANFEIDRKFEFLSNLAYVLTTKQRRTVFDRSNLQRVYFDICENYDLPRNEVQAVVEELETHTGLIVQSGYDAFEFAHRSIQEYLAAEYMVKLPSIPEDERIISQIPNELALAVAVSSSPSEYLAELVLQRFAKHKLREEFIRSFLSRLLIEKPEFNKSDLVCIAFLSMYSIYVETYVVGGRQKFLFYDDRLFKQFEQVVKSILKRNVMEFVEDMYEVRAEYGGDDERIVRLEKAKTTKRNGDRKNKFPAWAIPNSLFFRYEFMKDSNVETSPGETKAE